jgi:hypothetical protein
MSPLSPFGDDRRVDFLPCLGDVGFPDGLMPLPVRWFALHRVSVEMSLHAL